MNEFSSEMEETLAGGVFFFPKNGGMGNVRPARSSGFFFVAGEVWPRESCLPSVSRGLLVVQCPRAERRHPDTKIPSFVLLLACMFWTTSILEFE